MEMLAPGAELIPDQQIRPLKRTEYDRLVATGVFGPERIELLFGRLVEMSPTDAAHSESVTWIQECLSRQLANRARVRIQSPFAATETSEPEPDVVVVPHQPYWHGHPDRAFLVIEVARSSLAYDEGPKALLYGSCLVDEYWIVDHEHAQVIVYRDSIAGRWSSISHHLRGETIAMRAFPDVVLTVSEILPPLAD